MRTTTDPRRITVAQSGGQIGTRVQLLRVPMGAFTAGRPMVFIVSGRLGLFDHDDQGTQSYVELQLGDSNGQFFGNHIHRVNLYGGNMRKSVGAGMPFVFIYRTLAWPSSSIDLVLWGRTVRTDAFLAFAEFSVDNPAAMVFDLTALGAANYVVQSQAFPAGVALNFSNTPPNSILASPVIPWVGGTERWLAWFGARVVVRAQDVAAWWMARQPAGVVGNAANEHWGGRYTFSPSFQYHGYGPRGATAGVDQETANMFWSGLCHMFEVTNGTTDIILHAQSLYTGLTPATLYDGALFAIRADYDDAFQSDTFAGGDGFSAPRSFFGSPLKRTEWGQLHDKQYPLTVIHSGTYNRGTSDPFLVAEGHLQNGGRDRTGLSGAIPIWAYPTIRDGPASYRVSVQDGFLGSNFPTFLGFHSTPNGPDVALRWYQLVALTGDNDVPFDLPSVEVPGAEVELVFDREAIAIPSLRPLPFAPDEPVAVRYIDVQHGFDTELDHQMSMPAFTGPGRFELQLRWTLSAADAATLSAFFDAGLTFRHRLRDDQERAWTIITATEPIEDLTAGNVTLSATAVELVYVGP